MIELYSFPISLLSFLLLPSLSFSPFHSPLLLFPFLQSCIKYSTNKYQYQYLYQWSKYQYKYQYLIFKYQYQYQYVTFKYQYQYKYCA